MIKGRDNQQDGQEVNGLRGNAGWPTHLRFTSSRIGVNLSTHLFTFSILHLEPTIHLPVKAGSAKKASRIRPQSWSQIPSKVNIIASVTSPMVFCATSAGSYAIGGVNLALLLISRGCLLLKDIYLPFVIFVEAVDGESFPSRHTRSRWRKKPREMMLQVTPAR